MNIKNLVPHILTNNIEETKRFYLEKMGFRLTWDSAGYVGFKVSDAFQIAFRVPHEGESVAKCGITCAYEVDDVDQEHARLSKAGVTVVMPPEDHPWGDRAFVALDPNGVGLYFYEPRPVAQEMQSFVRQ